MDQTLHEWDGCAQCAVYSAAEEYFGLQQMSNPNQSLSFQSTGGRPASPPQPQIGRCIDMNTFKLRRRTNTDKHVVEMACPLSSIALYPAMWVSYHRLQ